MKATKPPRYHGCAISFCTRRIPHDQLMCPVHWHMLPVPTQNSIIYRWKEVKMEKMPHGAVTETRKKYSTLVKESIELVERECKRITE